MSVRRGASHSLIVGVEDSYNAGAATPVGHNLPITKDAFGPSQGPIIENPELQDDLEPVQGFDNLFTTTGTFGGAAELDSLSVLTYLLFTERAAITGAGPYVHVHSPGVADPPSIWADHYDAHATTPKYDLDYGCYLKGFSGNVSKQVGLFTLDWSVLGSGKFSEDGATPQDASPAAYTGSRLQPRRSKVVIDSVHIASIRECSFATDRVIEDDMGLNNLDYANEIIFGGFTHDISSLVATFDHASTLRALEDGAEHTVSIVIYPNALTTHYVSFDYTGVKFPKTNVRDYSQRGPITYSFSGLKPTGLSVENSNDVADPAAIL